MKNLDSSDIPSHLAQNKLWKKVLLNYYSPKLWIDVIADYEKNVLIFVVVI
jgi:hypothetical protein